MAYNIGMYGGSFDPPHIGHVKCIIRAASSCRKLFLVISFSRQRDHIPVELRYRWLRGMFRHMDNIEILLLEDHAPTKEDYDARYWESGRDRILEKIGQPVDVVFCGSDYQGSGIYEALYRCPVVCFDREETDISSTRLKQNPLKYWEFLPRECRPHFVKRVLIVGSESTGKSTLTANLALAYNTNYLKEVGREVSDYAGSEELMIPEDFQEILLRHKTKELECLKHSSRLLFIDTDALTTKFYSQFLLTTAEDKEKLGNLADAITALNRFDLAFFLEPTVAFVQDGTRNETIEADREFYSNQIKQLLDQAGIPYHCLGGSYADRFEAAKSIINKTFEL